MPKNFCKNESCKKSDGRTNAGGLYCMDCYLAGHGGATPQYILPKGGKY